MGIHDFVSYIQRNGQSIFPLESWGETKAIYDPQEDYEEDCEDHEEDCAGGNVSDAILVKVPETEDRVEILKWPLARFADFEHFPSRFTADEGWFFDFEEDDDLSLPGTYMGVLAGDDIDNHCVWKSKHYPGFWLVNFLEEEYKMFVRAASPTNPNTIPQEYYRLVFKERKREVPPTKREAFDLIARTFSTLAKAARPANPAQKAPAAIPDDDLIWAELGL